MLERLLNECILTVELELSGRLLVKEPAEETDARQQSRNDAYRVVQPVQTMRADGRPTLYLPGASLKGALRAQAERIARTLNRAGGGACDPFATLRSGTQPPANLACSERIAIRQSYHRRIQRQTPSGRELTVPALYSDVCPICRTFGYLGWGRRLRLTDFYPTQNPASLVMTHIGIDRVSGGVSTPYEGQTNYGSGRTFSLQYAYGGRLRGQIILENFELWQLGLIGFLWRDMADGLVAVGHRQTTGSGELHPHLVEMRLTRLGSTAPADAVLNGIGALFAGAERYGYTEAEDTLAWPELHWTRQLDTIRWEACLDEGAALRLWANLADRTRRMLRGHRWPESMAAGRIAQLATPEVAP